MGILFSSAPATRYPEPPPGDSSYYLKRKPPKASSYYSKSPKKRLFYPTSSEGRTLSSKPPKGFITNAHYIEAMAIANKWDAERIAYEAGLTHKEFKQIVKHSKRENEQKIKRKKERERQEMLEKQPIIIIY